MIHRHLEIPESASVEDMPPVAIVDILERGDLEDWRPLVRLVASDPWGPVATLIDRLVDEYPMYGTSPLWRGFIGRVRASGPPPDPMTLSELREAHGLTQEVLAKRLGMTQSDLSKLERRRDARVSTLSRVVAALGGRLRMMADLPNGQTELRLRADD